MSKKNTLTKSKKEKLHSLIEKGIPDTEISETMNMPWYYIQKYSSKYWKDKMKRKDNESES